MKKIIIIGAGGHAKVIVDIIINQQKYIIAGFIDEHLPKGTMVLDHQVLGKQDELSALVKQHSVFGGIVAIGDNFIRSIIVKDIKTSIKEFQFVNCIHPKSNIAYDVVMGEGNVVMAGATINTSSSIGNHCIFNSNSSVDHDNKISDFVSIGPNAVNGGDIRVGDFSAIGIGATVQHKIKIEHNCIVGANSLVNKNTKPNSVYYGVPAKYIREHKLGEKYL